MEVQNCLNDIISKIENEEEWRQCIDFPLYQVSNYGKKHFWKIL
jgi:hypothetical protein